MFASIVGVYVWTTKIYQDTKKSLGDIYNTINRHFQDSCIHRNENEFVPAKVCVALHTALKEKVDGIVIKQDIVQKELAGVAGDIKTILGKL